MRRDRIGPLCRGSGRRTSPSCAPRSPLLSPSTRARVRPWSARCYGVARQRDRSRQNSRGPRACFLSGISGSRVGAEESGAASFDLLVSAARCGATGSGRYAADRAGEPLHRAPPVHPFCHPLRARGSGRGLPAATGSLANAIGRAKTAEGLGRAFSPAFRARAWVPKNLARRVLIYWFRRRDAARPDRAAMPRIGPANLSIMPPRSPLLSPSTRARARPWSARCYGVARQRDRSRQNSRGPRACFLSGISGSRVGAEESGAASFDLLVSAARYGAAGSGRHAADRAGEPLHRAPPLTPSVTLYAREGQAVVCSLLRGRSPTRSVAPKQPRASGVLSLRHFGLARGCRRIWRGEF